MKTILVPTDFSACSDNATRYAVELAKTFGSTLILFHAYHTPVITAEAPLVIPTLEEMEHDTRHALAKIQNKILAESGNELKVECRSACGFATDEIETLLASHPVDLIVMGMRGAGVLEEKLVGSVTTSVIARVKAPVLTVDTHVSYSTPKNLVFAADLEKTSKATFKALNTIAGKFRSHIHIVNVIPVAEAVPDLKEAQAGLLLDKAIEGVDHTYHFVENEDIVNGINHYIDRNGGDMIIMVAREHSFFHRMFHESTTKKMAFHTHLPLLALHNIKN